MTEVVIWGAGGHGKVVYDVVTSAGHEVVAWLDDRGLETERYGRPVLETARLDSLMQRHAGLHVVVAVGDNRARTRIAAGLTAPLLTAVHASAVVHASVRLGAGTIVMPGAVINIDSVVGDNCIVNTGATIDHDCRIGNGVHLAPGTHLAGTVTVLEGAFVGIGASVLPQRSIGAWSMVGAGAVVTRDVPDAATAVGVPARFIAARKK